MTDKVVLMLSFGGYLTFILIIGIIASKFNKTLSDFLLGGRKLGPWLLSISERASGESAWLIVGFTGTAFAMGLKAIWIALGCALGIIFNWLFIAKKLREAGGKYDSLTIPDYLAERYGDKRHILRITSAVMILIFYVLYVSGQFMGTQKILEVAFNIPPTTGILIGAAIIIFYTALGGFMAVVWTDFFQGLIMLAALVLLPILGLIKLGGFGAAIEMIRAARGPEAAGLFYSGNFWQSVALVISGLGWGLGYMGQPHLLVRFMAFDDTKNIKKGATIAIIWTVLAYTGAVIIGIIGLAALKGSLENGTLFGAVITDKEHVMPMLALKLVPAFIAGIFISGAIAAMMSTADSQLLVCTSTVTEDYLIKVKKKDLSNKQMVRISRIVTVVLGVIALVFGMLGSKVFDQVLHAWAGLGATIGVTMLLSIYWKRSNLNGALWGMITGFSVVVIWNAIKILTHLEGVPKFFVYSFDNEIVPAFILAVAVHMIVSIATKKTEVRG